MEEEVTVEVSGARSADPQAADMYSVRRSFLGSRQRLTERETSPESGSCRSRLDLATTERERADLSSTATCSTRDDAHALHHAVRLHNAQPNHLISFLLFFSSLQTTQGIQR